MLAVATQMAALAQNSPGNRSPPGFVDLGQDSGSWDDSLGCLEELASLCSESHENSLNTEKCRLCAENADNKHPNLNCNNESIGFFCDANNACRLALQKLCGKKPTAEDLNGQHRCHVSAGKNQAKLRESHCDHADTEFYCGKLRKEERRVDHPRSSINPLLIAGVVAIFVAIVAFVIYFQWANRKRARTCCCGLCACEGATPLVDPRSDLDEPFADGPRTSW